MKLSLCRVHGQQEEPENSSADVLPEMGPVTFEEHKKMLQEMVQKDFKELLKGKVKVHHQSTKPCMKVHE